MFDVLLIWSDDDEDDNDENSLFVGLHFALSAMCGVMSEQY